MQQVKSRLKAALLLCAMQAAYFDQKFHSTFFLAPEAGTGTVKLQGARPSSKQHGRQRSGNDIADTGRQLALVTRQDQQDVADDTAGFGSDVDGDQQAQQPLQLQLTKVDQHEAQMDQLYLLVESQKAAMR